MMPEEKEAENIRVAVRCRPMNERENREQAVSCFTCGLDGLAVLTNMENPTETHEFGFDFVYGCDSKQELVFEDIGLPLLDRAFGGYNGTIFAYGQTGSGKSFSMTGVTGGPETLEGLIPRVNRAIFDRVVKERVENPNKRFLVECSYFEIYNEIIYDLLDSNGNGKKAKGGLEIKEHSVLGIYVKDLQERVVETREEIVELMALGAQSRTVGYTQMNAESSRSHSIFTIKIHQKDAEDETKSVFAKINLVDLAGSERAASTGAHGDRLREGANINKSLSALGNVINALVEASRASKKVFIPYRNSKLTRVLQESLGGNSLCSMLATLSPASINFAETLSTLRYASRAKSIKVNAKKNEASSQISQLNEEIAALKQKLQEQMGATLGLDPKEKDDIVTKYEKQIQEMDRVRLQTWEDKAKLSKQHEMERKKLARERAQADQRIQDERIKKWRLLDDKGDLELMLRALCDLDGTNCAVAGAGEDVVAVQWLETAQKMKVMEGEAKDLRTLVQVFRDSFQKDVELWARRCGLASDATNATENSNSHRREDSAAASGAHMTVSQMNSKLQNIGDESEKLLTLENRLVSDRSALINTMTSELLHVKTRRAQLKADQSAKIAALAGTTTSIAAQASKAAKEEEQLLEERERGLAITLALVRIQRTAFIQSVQRDRLRFFDYSLVIQKFACFADQHNASSQGNSVKDLESAHQHVRWDDAKTKLLAVSKAWEDVRDAKIEECNITEFVGDGEVTALGLESRLLTDECFSASSNVRDAKFVRLNGSECWCADTQDATPSLVIDFEFPRVFDSVSVRGGMIQFEGSDGPSANRQVASQAKPSISLPTSTFVLASVTDLQAARARCKVDEVTGSNDVTYELLSHVMSWQDLLKTDVIPAKLFARPPVRFLHDVVSAVMRNTGFACDAITTTQRDYAQLPTKSERAEYLSALLNYVQAWYRRQEQSDEMVSSVTIAATTSNILAGKEPVDTVAFLGYLALAALDHVIQNANAENKDQAVLDNNDEVCEVERECKKSSNAPEDGWVTRLRIASSFTGSADDWRVLGEFDANTDAKEVISIPLAVDKAKAEGSRAGRFLQLTCIQWHHRAALQCEVFGRQAHESNSLAEKIEAMALKARALVNQLRHTSVLVLQEARASYDRAKVAESEKHAQLTSYGEELAKLKLASAAWEKEEREMQEQCANLSSQLKTANKRVDQERTRGDALQTELAQFITQVEEAKRRGDTLQTQLSEKEHQLQTLLMQIGEQRRAHEALQQTKQQLEVLASNLRAQLTDEKHEKDISQQEGQSHFAELTGELMSLRVQLDEQHRAVAAAELQYKDQEAFGKQQYALLQQTRAALFESEAEADAKLKAHTAVSEAALSDSQNERDRLKQDLGRALASENVLKQAAVRLEAQCAATGAELDKWRQRAEAAEIKYQSQSHTGGAGGADASDSSDTAELDAVGRENQRLLLEAQTNDLRRLAEMEKMGAKVRSLEKEITESNEKAQRAEQALLESLQRVKECEEIEEELQLQLQVVTDERDSARQKEEQLFAEANEKDQEIERIRDGYVWVTDRMNLKEDELSELQEQLERYQALMKITGAKDGDVDFSPPVKPKEDKLRAEIAKLYASATGAVDAVEGSGALIVKLSEWIEMAKNLIRALPNHVVIPQGLISQFDHRIADHVKDSQTIIQVKSIKKSSGEETDYEDDFDELDVSDKAR